MHLRSLALENIRNIKAARLEPGPSINVLHGDNGAGKTTVLEALVLLAKGRSFRSGPLAALIGPEQPLFRVVTELVTDEGNDHRLGIERDREGWRGRLDGETMQHVTAAAGLLPLVIMEPNSHALVSGSPDHRRRYLDWTVFHVKHDFLIEWRRYARALKQRNAALRSGNRALVASLDPQLIGLGESLHAQRAEVFEELAPTFAENLAQLSPSLGKPGVELRSGWGDIPLAEALESSLERDLELGQTRQGPHRADLLFRVRGKSVRDRLSRGEQKILAAACLLAQGALFARVSHVPLMLLDDLASEFDADHLEQVVRSAQALGAQLFVTGTDAAPYKRLAIDKARLFHVEHGAIRQTTGAG